VKAAEINQMSSRPDLIRASIHLHKNLFEFDGLPVALGERRASRFRPAMTN